MQLRSSNRQRSLAGLIADLWRESADLIREEAALARAEVSDKAARIGSGMVWLAAGFAVLFAGLVLLLAAAVAGIAQVLPEELAPWLAPLVAGGVVLPGGVALLARGKRLITSTNLTPDQSLRSVRKDVEVLKEHMQ